MATNRAQTVPPKQKRSAPKIKRSKMKYPKMKKMKKKGY